MTAGVMRYGLLALLGVASSMGTLPDPGSGDGHDPRALSDGQALQASGRTSAEAAMPEESERTPREPRAFEVPTNDGGPIAYRRRDRDGGWELPRGDAVMIGEGWWTPMRPLTEASQPTPPPARAILQRMRQRLARTAPGRRPERVTDVAIGDVTLDGEAELVVAFRRPFVRNFINRTRPRSAWADDDGLSAHLGLFRPHDLSEVWVAGTLVRPVVEVAACQGGLAVAYGRLNSPGTVATGAWRWVVFGFLPLEPLPGPGVPICVDIDGDGRTEPAVIERSGP